LLWSARLLAALRRLRRAFPDLRVVMEDLLAEGERVSVRWTLTGTHTGRVGGMEPTGRALRYGGMALFGVRDARVTEGWMAGESTDRALLQALGLLATSE
jgi:predicted ester cyclase